MNELTPFAPDPVPLQKHKEHLGNCIRKARKAQKISQEKFAEKLNYSVDTIYNLERGRFSSYDLAYTALLYLHIPLDDLFPAHAKSIEEQLNEAMSLLKDQINRKDNELIRLRRELEQRRN